MRASRPAYTLLEVLLVLALIVILGAVAYPTIDGMYVSLRLQAAADCVRGAWAQARAHAMNEGRPYRVAIQADQRTYRVAPDSPEFWSGPGGGPGAEDSGDPPFVLEAPLPRTVQIAVSGRTATENGPDAPPPGTSAASAPADAVVFLPDGRARQDAELTLRAPGTRPLIVRLRGMTGIVTTRWGQRGRP